MRVQEIATHLLQSLDTYGWGAVDNFLGTVHADNILKEVPFHSPPQPSFPHSQPS